MECGGLFDGKYRIVRLLGSGGCGRVYLAENIRTGGLWAIKEITCGDGELGRVGAEIEILKDIRHHALPRVVDVIRGDGLIYIVEDYIEGRTLAEILAESGPADGRTAIGWALEICDIMSFLHSRKPEPVIYRDLKPSNIIVSPEGAIRLVDFGGARLYKAENTTDTVYIGTRGYAAPEQYGYGQTSKRTDVYSFGVTLRHVVTGAPDGPYEHISRELACIIEKCAMFDPAARYADFAEIKADLLKRAAGHGSGVSVAEERMGAVSPSADGPYASRTSPARRRSSVLCQCVTLSVTRNHEFAFELAHRAAERHGLRVLILDLDFETSLSVWYYNVDRHDADSGGLLRAIELAERAWRGDGGSQDGAVSADGVVSADEAFSAEGAISANGGRARDVFSAGDAIFADAGAAVGIGGLSRLAFPNPYQPSIRWFAESDPARAARAAARLTGGGGCGLRGFLRETTRRADLCVLLTGGSAFGPLNMCCFQNSHYTICPGPDDITSARAFMNTAALAEYAGGVPADRFKYVFWDYTALGAGGTDALWELGDSALAGAVRRSGRRDAARRGAPGKRCYAASMEKPVQKEYDDIIAALGITEISKRH